MTLQDYSITSRGHYYTTESRATLISWLNKAIIDGIPNVMVVTKYSSLCSSVMYEVMKKKRVAGTRTSHHKEFTIDKTKIEWCSERFAMTRLEGTIGTVVLELN